MHIMALTWNQYYILHIILHYFVKNYYLFQLNDLKPFKSSHNIYPSLTTNLVIDQTSGGARGGGGGAQQEPP